MLSLPLQCYLMWVVGNLYFISLAQQMAVNSSYSSVRIDASTSCHSMSHTLLFICWMTLVAWDVPMPTGHHLLPNCLPYMLPFFHAGLLLSVSLFIRLQVNPREFQVVLMNSDVSLFSSTSHPILLPQSYIPMTSDQKCSPPCIATRTRPDSNLKNLEGKLQALREGSKQFKILPVYNNTF